MKKPFFAVAAIASFLIGGPARGGVDVIYIPQGFPNVCGWSLTEDRARCPEGVTAQAESFCSQGLHGLDAARSALGVPDCQGSNMASPFLVPLAESAVQLVLLIDDTNASGELRSALGPILESHNGTQMIEPSFRVFTDSLSRARQTLVVGEALFRAGGSGGQATDVGEWQERIRRLMTQGGPLGEVQDSARLPESSDGAQESTQTSPSQTEETARALSTPTPSRTERSEQQRSDSAAESQSQAETGDRLSTPRQSGEEAQTQSGQSSFRFEEMEIPIPFKRSFVQWRDDAGRALAREIPGIDRSQAYSIARNSEGLRRYHSELAETGTENGHEVYVPVTVMFDEADSSVESVAIYDDDGA